MTHNSSSSVEFMGDFEHPELFVDPLHGEGLTSLRGKNAFDGSVRNALRETIGPRQANDDIVFEDTDTTIDMAWLLDRYEDATAGINPGNPWVVTHEYEPNTSVEEIVGQEATETERRLARFFQATNVRAPRQPVEKASDSDIQSEGTWGGAAFKLQGNIKMPLHGSRAQSFLHELGHCTMGVIGFSKETTTSVDVDDLNKFRVDNNYFVTTFGLEHIAEGETRGLILEEGVAEALGSLVNQKLGIVTPKEVNTDIPDELQKYIIDGKFSFSSPAAMSLEMIAKEIGLPFEQYLKMLVDYANVGVHNVDARQEVAESISKGTRGRLTLAQVEGLPYPTNKHASLALLWAVESALDTPDHERYSQHFFPGE